MYDLVTFQPKMNRDQNPWTCYLYSSIKLKFGIIYGVYIELLYLIYFLTFDLRSFDTKEDGVFASLAFYSAYFRQKLWIHVLVHVYTLVFHWVSLIKT